MQWHVGSGVNIRYILLRWRHPSTSCYFLLEILLSWNNLIIWNNCVEIHRKNQQVRIIIFRRTLWYNSLRDPTRQHEVWRKILLYYINANWSDRKQRIQTVDIWPKPWKACIHYSFRQNLLLCAYFIWY